MHRAFERATFVTDNDETRASPVEGATEHSSAISKELQRLNAKWWAEQRNDETKKRGTNDT